MGSKHAFTGSKFQRLQRQQTERDRIFLHLLIFLMTVRQKSGGFQRLAARKG